VVDATTVICKKIGMLNRVADPVYFGPDRSNFRIDQSEPDYEKVE
jgi:hypothetical protein